MRNLFMGTSFHNGIPPAIIPEPLKLKINDPLSRINLILDFPTWSLQTYRSYQVHMSTIG